MTPLSASAVLTLWEQGVPLHPLDRGLLALRVADPSATAGVADWPLGRRNRALLDLHASWFGAQLAGWTSCPACDEKVEFELDARQLAAIAPDSEPADPVIVGEQAFRLPTSRDLACMVAAGDAEYSAAGLAERCRIGGPHTVGWTDDLLETIGEQLAAADPLAETRLALGCPSCGRGWDAALEIGRFVWAAVDAQARRLLWEVHALGSAYGWSEPEILALSAPRRAIYLEMVHA
jgi:hypothetical protein